MGSFSTIGGGVTKLSELEIDTDLAMDAHNITLDDGQTVDGKDEYEIVAGLAPYAGDESEVTETSTTYVTKKEFYAVKDSTNLRNPSIMVVEVEGYVTSGNTLTVGIAIDGGIAAEITFTETSYTLKSTIIDISGWTDGKHHVELQMKVDGGTGYNKLWEVWMK